MKNENKKVNTVHFLIPDFSFLISNLSCIHILIFHF
jgi:hypothetical protein